MAKDMPYMISVKNLPGIFGKIRAAQTPPKFTHEFLKSNLGFSSSGDRAAIQVLKALGFLDADSIPTARYNEFRAEATSGKAIAVGLREGWSEIFLSNQNAHQLPPVDLTGIFKRVTGKSDSVAGKMAFTFGALCKLADFSAPAAHKQEMPSDAGKQHAPPARTTEQDQDRSLLTLRHDIHIHLPPTTDVAVYSAIFRAIKEELLD